MGAALSTPRAAFASWHGGTGSISGTVLDDTGDGAVRDIRLYGSFSGLLIRKVISAEDGTYSFTNLKVGLIVDVVFLDDSAGTTYEHLVDSRVVVA